MDICNLPMSCSSMALLLTAPFSLGAQKNEILNDQKLLFGLIFGPGEVGCKMFGGVSTDKHKGDTYN